MTTEHEDTVKKLIDLGLMLIIERLCFRSVCTYKNDYGNNFWHKVRKLKFVNSFRPKDIKNYKFRKYVCMQMSRIIQRNNYDK